MDALFGLPRKREAGKSYRDALYDQLYFLKQDDVDKYVEDSCCAESLPLSTVISLSAG